MIQVIWAFSICSHPSHMRVQTVFLPWPWLFHDPSEITA